VLADAKFKPLTEIETRTFCPYLVTLMNGAHYTVKFLLCLIIKPLWRTQNMEGKLHPF